MIESKLGLKGLNLVKTFFIVLTGSFAFLSGGTAQNIIDFNKGTNLKVVYDSGLRPWRIRPDETSTLSITDQKVRIIAPQSDSFDFEVKNGSFQVVAENELGGAHFFGEITSLVEAESKVRGICQALDLPVEGLKEAVDSIIKLRTNAPQRYWAVQIRKNGVLYGVTLQPVFGFKETTARVIVTFDFHHPGKPMKFLSEPIKPPAGYENVSMEPPPRDPNQKPFPNPSYDTRSQVLPASAITSQEATTGSSPVGTVEKK